MGRTALRSLCSPFVPVSEYSMHRLPLLVALLALVALTLPVLLISMDATILGFAVPRLSEDLQPSSAELLCTPLSRRET